MVRYTKNPDQNMPDAPNTMNDSSVSMLDLLLTRDLPGIGGTIRQRIEDFCVEEIPLYPPCGEGEHIYLFVEKRNLTTQDAIGIIARHFGVSRSSIGFAGLKDKRAVTRQTLSILAPGRTADDFPMLQHADLSVLWVDHHTNKLRRGHLAGNRFSIKIRNVDMSAAVRAHRCAELLIAHGLPNSFGPQRFGVFGRNHLVGRALFLNDCDGAMHALLGIGCQVSNDQVLESARDHFLHSNFAKARDSLPFHFQTERLLLNELARGASTRVAWGCISSHMRGLYYSSFQSAVFNRVLANRLNEGTLATLSPGDLVTPAQAQKITSVTPDNIAELQTRVDQHELSPTGPLWGTRMLRTSGNVDRAEVDALASFGMTPENLADCRDTHSEMVGGSRRAMRVPVTDFEIEGGTDEYGPFVRCAFDLPRGAFATAVLQEIMKVDLADHSEERPDES